MTKTGRQMKWKFDLPKSPELVYYLVKLTGLAPVTIKNNRFHPPTLIGKLYPVFLAVSYLLFVTTTYTPIVEMAVNGDYPPFIKGWSAVLHLLSLPNIISTLIIFLLMYQKIVYLGNKLCIMSHGLRSLDIEEDDSKYIDTVWKRTVMANTTLVATFVINISMEPYWHIFLSIKYCIDDWFAMNTISIFVQTLICIRRYFSMVNKKLDEILISAAHLGLPHHSQIYVTGMNLGEENQSESKGLTGDIQLVQKLNALHLELCDLVDRTTRLFALPILLNGLRLSTQFMLSLYFVYYNTRNSHDFQIASMACTVLRTATLFALLFIISYASATTCEQGNATKAVLFKVLTKFRRVELTNKFVVFPTQLRTPIAVAAFGFIDLNYSFIFKIFSTVVTYLIVIVQLQK